MEDLLSIAQNENIRELLSLEPFFFFFNKRVAAIAKVHERNVKQGSIVLRIEVEVK
jgi:hypothetical protein